MDDLEIKYFTPSHPGSFSGIDKFFRGQNGKASRKQVKNFLKSHDAYTYHAPVRYRFPRNRVVVAGMNQLYDTDLLSMQSLSAQNDQFSWILTAIDVFSKYTFCEPLKTKTSQEVTEAFRRILVRARKEGRRFFQLRSDMGGEYKNFRFQKLMREFSIQHFFSYNQEVKSGMAERLQRTLKLRLSRIMTKRNSGRWVDVLQKVVHSYNHTYHRSIGMTPASVTEGKVEQEVWRNLYESDPQPVKQEGSFQFAVGDTVRLSQAAKVFRREYNQRWTTEIFRVSSRMRRGPYNIFKISDLNGSEILGTFYSRELELITVDLTGSFVIDHVIRTKKSRGVKMYLVRWRGYGPKFDSWISEKDFTPVE